MTTRLIRRIHPASPPCGPSKATTMWPGPMASRPERSAPLLSWFTAPTTRPPRDTLVCALDAILRENPQLGEPGRIAALMARVLDSDALHLRRRIESLPDTMTCTAPAGNIVVIDERIHSEVDIGVRPRERLRQFAAMLQNLADTQRDARIWILRSNDPGRGAWLSDRIRPPRQVHHLPQASSLREVLRHTGCLYVVGASEGMAALLAGVPVHVFGAPYYAGWGLTNDNLPLTDRSARPTLAALFDAAFVRLAHYRDLETHADGTLDGMLDAVELQHAVARRFANLRRIVAIRFQWWKRPFATPYLTAGGGKLRWSARSDAPGADECAALWGARGADGLPAAAPRVRMEDGFIHSTGLGSDMSAPRSQVIDGRGLYFDASAPSDLSVLLNTLDCAPEELARAAALRSRIVATGITKYNLGRKTPNWSAPAGRRVALVPGQVADDASIRLGTRGIRSLDALLRRVRERHPHAFVVYKPHPDVLSGNRKGLVDAARLADVVDTESDMVSLIEVADEVHTLSSLAGFDALLRGKHVCTYGMPFYAGWGLTDDDLAPLPWRERTLTLDMLIAGALLRYPLYWDWRLELYTTPEAVVGQLSEAAARPLRTVAQDQWRPYIKAFRWIRNAMHHWAWRFRQALDER
ncbi:capsular polysaccharide export protein, LipB/KpsS family [Burkholderia vietnamiensis]|uniref:capsular polysaccharide export protein, LipB/KpsS family n=1 Tax=Burkholderia vietnamiensis TaxID=60552 RepID=UPI0007533A21|nr:capsular biosynthesis protein [Burkholderia vietnamiensis]KVR81026.1 capsular biosynthesis protein [Burkholderia vietnamiensis]UEC04722.1 capsular biosynthesis protein [Burkholderia vietnamiensis]HDR8988603.1 capsular biosynthesis protein [Burkholderia vietnamiensis]